ncbi:hypothetical protein [Haloferula sp. A504]|uniref:hypothetical protein n=1 Tax=Haloferula sp. A504 TaxID=3373601 RepID=UPI0031CBFB03|nr:autotransporter domain-containing protein [Verrucomicrobiaceae bacterium E54]
MKRYLATALLSAIGAISAQAQEGLYYIGSEAQEPLPLEWSLGINFTWDDNVTPTAIGLGANESAFSVNPYVGLSFVNITPRSTLDLYARVGAIYYLDAPSAIGADDLNPQFRMGLNWTHRFTERLRFTSRNFAAYELEPDYAYGFATSRQNDAYFHWGTTNAVGFRWTERLATYTGFGIRGLDYDSAVNNQDRLIYELFHQFRYQLTPQTVATFDYRYSQTEADGFASDSSSHFVLLGVEHRFSPNTIIVAKAGAQFRESDARAGSNATSPFVELALRSNINDQFSIRSFVRYGIEDYDTTRIIANGGAVGLYDFDDRRTLRVGIRGNYEFSPRLSAFTGIDYIPADFGDGRLVAVQAGLPALTANGIREDLFNIYAGVNVRFTDRIYGSLSYNFTTADSDFVGQSYDRNRVTVGVHAQF